MQVLAHPHGSNPAVERATARLPALYAGNAFLQVKRLVCRSINGADKPFLRSKTEIKEVQVTNLVGEQSEWVLTYDYGEGQLCWNSHIPLWEATAMLEGLFRGIGVAGADIPTYIRRNYEQRVTVQCGETTYYEGMLGNLARIALDELDDETLQNEKRSAPTQGRGTR